MRSTAMVRVRDQQEKVVSSRPAPCWKPCMFISVVRYVCLTTEQSVTTRTGESQRQRSQTCLPTEVFACPRNKISKGLRGNIRTFFNRIVSIGSHNARNFSLSKYTDGDIPWVGCGGIAGPEWITVRREEESSTHCPSSASLDLQVPRKTDFSFYNYERWITVCAPEL